MLHQINHGPKIEIEKYGPTGCLRLCTARAISVDVILFGVLGIAFAIAGLVAVALPLFVLVWLVGVLSVSRSVLAGR